MSMNEKEFETLLRSRHIEPPRTGFAERVIAATKYSQPSSVNSFGVWLQALLADLVLPRPAFALASVLMLGFAIGLSAPVTSAGEDSMSVQSYLESDGAVL